MAVITISRQVGSQGSYIAAEVARILGWRYYDREILHQAAATVGLTTEADFERLVKLDERPGAARRILDVVGVQPAIPAEPSATLRELQAARGEIEALVKREELTVDEARERALSKRHTLPLTETHYRNLMTQVVTELAQAGNSIIIGRGANVILSAHTDVLRVQVVAHYLVRVERLMDREGLNRASAKLRVTDSDQMRAEFMRRYFGVDWLDPSLYDVVFNTSGHVSEQTIIDSIVTMAREM
jgi:cytidylate kinase